jgi:hypothetical protein
VGLQKFEAATRRGPSTSETATTVASNNNCPSTSNDRTLISTTIDEEDHAKFEIDTALLPAN